jgi:hypothetical protein
MSINEKAKRTVPFIVEEQGNSCDFYTVPKLIKGDGGFAPDPNVSYMVIHNITKNMWTCTCRFFTFKGTDCSHILASKMKRNERLR